MAHLAFPGPALNVLPIGWTLTIEMLYSLLLPPLFLLARRAHPLAPLALLGTAVALLPGVSWLWHSVAFCLGLAAYLERERLGRWVGASPPLGVALTACGLLLFSWPLLGDWSIVRFGLLIQPVTLRSTLTLALGSVLLVVAAVHVGWLTRMLSTRPMRFLGRISYSLYLVHFLVLIACAPLANGDGAWTDFAMLLCAVLVLSLALSVLGYQAVGRPSIRLGNRVCNWLAPRMGTADLRSERADAGE
jgi:peptidoglycan/LPS O-acetylase OafA/YrhL